MKKSTGDRRRRRRKCWRRQRQLEMAIRCVSMKKNEKLGKKLFITGKGRCNLTNACDIDVLFESVVTNSRFLYSSFYGFTNQDAISFFLKNWVFRQK